MIDLPIKFPSDTTVISEEVARFRSLSSADRMKFIRGLIAAGAMMIQRSPKAAYLRNYALEQEERAKHAIKEFVARHAR